MKLTWGKRVVLFLHWLCSVLLLAAIAVEMTTQKVLELLRELIGAEYADAALIFAGAIYALLCILAVVVILKRDGHRSERGFITVDSSDAGKVRIAVTAIEQMVKQAVGAIDGIAEMKIAISNSDDAISITVNTLIYSGVHVPTVTMNMQRAIRQFVEMNCGVAVSTVSVNVQAVATPGEGRKGRASKGATPIQPVSDEPLKASVPMEEPLPDPVPLIQRNVEPVAECVLNPETDAPQAAETETEDSIPQNTQQDS